jgi:hypothetical protein
MYSYKIIDLSRDATDRDALYLVSSQVSDALLGIESEVVYVCTRASIHASSTTVAGVESLLSQMNLYKWSTTSHLP